MQNEWGKIPRLCDLSVPYQTLIFSQCSLIFPSILFLSFSASLPSPFPHFFPFSSFLPFSFSLSPSFYFSSILSFFLSFFQNQQNQNWNADKKSKWTPLEPIVGFPRLPEGFTWTTPIYLLGNFNKKPSLTLWTQCRRRGFPVPYPHKNLLIFSIYCCFLLCCKYNHFCGERWCSNHLNSLQHGETAVTHQTPSIFK